MAERARALAEQIDHFQNDQHQLLLQINRVTQQAIQGRQASTSFGSSDVNIQEQISKLALLAQTREYVSRLKGVAEAVKQLERLIRPATELQREADVEPLVELCFAAANLYVSCKSGLEDLSCTNYPDNATPQQLRGLEHQLAQQLQAWYGQLRLALNRQIHRCLEQCGWPPPVVPPKAGGVEAGEAALFSPAHAQQTNQLQRLMLALTKLQLVSQQGLAPAAGQTDGCGDSNSDSPLLWMAVELAAPLNAQLQELFGPSGQGQPGDINNPDLVLGTVHRLALENVRHIEFLQAVVQALELHGMYHISVEFTRALQDGVKQLLRTYKLPEVAARGDRNLWLAWIDALIAFEGSLGRSGLLGCYWEVGDARDLPVLLLKGSTLSVLGEDPAWMDAWLEAEAAGAAGQVESVLYSEQGWGPGQTLLLLEDGCPAWQADLWPPRAAEELVSLVESLLDRLRFIPQPAAQERYLVGAVGAVLEQAHGRILRMLQQADVFKDITSYTWLPRVCMCICFCHYVEQQLQELHGNTHVMVTRLLDSQQQQHNNMQPPSAHQQQSEPANGAHSMNNTSWESHAGQAQQQNSYGQLLPGPSAAVLGSSSTYASSSQRQAANEQVVQVAAAKLRLLARPMADFGSCRREWVLKLGKAAAMGFMQHASGYVSHGTLFKASSEALPALAADGQLHSSGVVSGDLQPALAWLAQLLEAMSSHLDRSCFRQAWSAAAAAINRELFNDVACEAIFSDAGALQLEIDVHALLQLFGHYTPRPAAHFRELSDAVKLLTLPQQQADFIKQAVSASSRAANAAEVLKTARVYHLSPELADTVMSLRMYK